MSKTKTEVIDRIYDEIYGVFTAIEESPREGLKPETVKTLAEAFDLAAQHDNRSTRKGATATVL